MLAGVGTALAGCGDASEVISSDDDTVSYDQSALTDLAERTPPQRPNAFPLSIPSDAFGRH